MELLQPSSAGEAAAALGNGSVALAGGTELVPRSEWKFPQRAARLESVYALVRPVYEPQDVANAVLRALAWRRREPEVVRAYCRGAVAHLSWETLWPRWRSWFRKGLEAL